MKVLDTNVLIYHVKGLLAQSLTGSEYVVSIVTEIEVLSHPKLGSKAEAAFRTLLAGRVVPIDDEIKERAIQLRRKANLRVPDAIIAATAAVTDLELLTHDSSLLKVSGLRASAPPLKEGVALE